MNKHLFCHLALTLFFILFSLLLFEAESATSFYSLSPFNLPSKIDTIPNHGNGIYLNNASNNIIGNSGTKVANTIIGNEYGIYISGDDNRVFNNTIGTDTLQRDSLGNTHAGIFISGAKNQIGGSSSDSMNLIVSNGANGIEIEGASAFENIITGNSVGTDINGIKELGNQGIGINILNAKDNRIGSFTESGRNIIAFNKDAGIAITGNQSINNTILINQLYTNEGLGIDLNHDAVTYNDFNDVDNGPNNLLNFPEVTDLYYDSEVLAYNFSIDVPKGNYYIAFYNNKTLDPSGYGEGAFFLGAITISHNESGSYHYSGSFPPNYPPENDDNITLTATALIGNDFKNSSEFSAYRTIISSCENIINPGKISGLETNCGNYIPTPIISLIQARGGSGSPIEYKWQKSLDNIIWSDIPNTNSVLYNPKLVKETTMFRRAARRLNCTGGWIYSNIINKDVARTISRAGIISGNESSPTSFNPSEINNNQPASGGIGQIDYQWYQKTENSNWVSILGEKGSNYDPPFITETTYYKREAHIISCDYPICCSGNPFLYSNIITKRVAQPLKSEGEIFFSLKSLKEYDNPITSIVTYLKVIKERDKTEVLLKAAKSSNEDANNFLEYKWETSKDGKYWTEIYGATKKNYTPAPNDHLNPFYKRKIRRKNTSNWAYSNIIKLPQNLIQEKKVAFSPPLAKRFQKYTNKKMLLALNIFLEGALDKNHLMRDDIRAKELLPLKSPYNLDQNLETKQYLNSTVLQKTGRNAIVDWILIELYTSNSITGVPVITKSALIQRDGDIVDYDGISPVHIEHIPEGNYWIMLRHRNHQPVISTSVIPLKKGMINAFVDFCHNTSSNQKKNTNVMPSSIHQKRVFFSALKNQRKIGYETLDYDMNGLLITKGPNNEYSSFFMKVHQKH